MSSNFIHQIQQLTLLLQQKKIKYSMDQFTKLKLTFSTIYGEKQKSDKFAEIFFKDIVDYLRNDNNQKHFFSKDKERQDVLSLLTKAKEGSDQNTIRLIFKCQYCCCVVLRKATKQSPIDISIISPEQWITNTDKWKNQKLDFCQPQKSKTIYITQVDNNVKSLEDFYQNFKSNLKISLTSLNREASERKQQYQYSVQTVEKACERAKIQSKISTSYFKPEQEGQDKQKEKQAKASGKGILMNNSQVNTSWYIPAITAVQLMSNDKKYKAYIKKLIIGYKAYLLEKVTRQKALKSQYDQEEVTNFKKCLDDLIFTYRSAISMKKSKVNRIKDFQLITKQIYDNLMKITKNGLTSKIQDTRQKQGELKFQHPRDAFMAKVDKIQHASQPIVLQQIPQYPLSVSQRLPFEDLLQLAQNIQQKQLAQKGKWILLTERTFFSLTKQLAVKDEIIDLKIHMRQVLCQIGSTTMLQVVEIYEKIVNKNKQYFGMGMVGQAICHIQLVKNIAAVIAFEMVKMNRQKKNSNLKKYRIPFDLQEFYQFFVSHSYQARAAMRNLRIYNYSRKKKQMLFKLDGTSDSFIDYARIVGKETRSSHVWKRKMQRIQSLQQQRVLQQFQVFQTQKKLNEMTQKLRIYGLKSGYLSSKIQNIINEVNDQVVQNYYPRIITQFRKNDPWVHAFLQNIPPDVLGLLKAVMLAQNPNLKSQNSFQNNLFDNYFPHEKLPVTPISLRPPEQTQLLHSQITTSTNCIQINKIYNGVTLAFQNSLTGNILDTKTFQYYPKLFFTQQLNDQYGRKFQYIMRPPTDSNTKDREHMLYAGQTQKPNQISVQDFLAIGNVRSANNTQLMVLCQNILEKKIIANSYDQVCLLANEVIFQTTGQLSTYHHQIQIQFGQVRKLLNNFIKVWGFTDVKSCPILGPFFGYIGRQILDDDILEGQDINQQRKNIRKVVFDMCRKCIQQFKQDQKQAKSKPNLKIQWSQRFTVTAAICCLRQIILEQEQTQEIQMLCELIFLLRSSKILSDRQERPKNKRKFQEQLLFSVQKCIFYNIQIMSSYVERNPDSISKIVKTMDFDFSDKTVWNKINTFAFEGRIPNDENSNIYQLDLFNGKIFKNGKEISALDPKIKENEYFWEIFGSDRQFQVYQSHEAYFLRTKDNFNYQFKINEKKASIFFQFSQDGKQIRHIIRPFEGTTSDEQIWILVSREKLKQSKCWIPKLFMDHYLAWYCQKRKCIVFRRNKFGELYKIGMVVHLEDDQNFMRIIKAYYITFYEKYDDQDLDQICKKQTDRYDEMILRDKGKKLQEIKYFEILKEFQRPEYIFELVNKKTKEIQYFLHRYQMKFKIEDQTRFVSETFCGYSLDWSFYSNSKIIFNQFPCLVLKKHSQNPAFLNNQNRILIISDGNVEYGGKINRSYQADRHINSFKYQIHDFFGDIRGNTRESIFHLSALMLSINDNIKIKSIQMTPLDYSMYLLKCCLTNRPLNKSQNKKLNHIIQKLEPPPSIVLLCEVIWKCSKQLKEILPFPKEIQHYSVFRYSLEKALMTCRTLYEDRFKEQILRYREKLTDQMLNYIGVNIRDKMQQQDSSSADSSEQTQSDIYWKGMEKFDGTKFVSEMKDSVEKFEQFNEQTTDFFSLWISAKKQAEEATFKQVQISSKFGQLAENQNCNKMTIQMIQQLEISTSKFLQDNHMNQTITNKILSGQRKQLIEKITQLQQKGRRIVKGIQQIIDNIKQMHSIHPDIITGAIPTISFICFTSLICNPETINNFFPQFDKKISKIFEETMKIWVEMKTRLASFERIKILLQAQTLDFVALSREALSPRNQVRQKPYWLCFEAQNKVQLWASQLDVYLNLMNQQEKPGCFCQLNMGQGKTQVIIPMMILNTIYGKNKKGALNIHSIPRVNLLSSLMEEARGNFFRFLSVTGFQISGFQIPFTRKVQLRTQNIYKVRNTIRSFSNKLYILMTRQSRLSEILRYYQVNQTQKEITMEKQPLVQAKIFDIFDEIDALMTPLKSYIFSIGQTEQLSSWKLRFQILRILIEAFLKRNLADLLKKGIVTTEEPIEVSLKFVQRGQYPPGLRMDFNGLSQGEILQIRREICKNVLEELSFKYFSFYKHLNAEFKTNLIEYLINPTDLSLKLPEQTDIEWKQQIFLLRGILGYGIFEHCLSMRCGVDYGVPNKLHIKKIAVPYEAADIPSKTSQYQHPDVSIILSYFAYYTKSLNLVQFKQALVYLLKLSNTSKAIQYHQWYESLSKEKQPQTKVINVLQINLDSETMIQELFKVYKNNRKTIAFWLDKCIFPTNLRQYKKSICASAWDLADVTQSVGFSGTKDNHWLYSNKLTWKPCQTPAIKGTDGKMIHLITHHTQKICLIKEDDKSQWQRFVDAAIKQKVDCIIDAGALCVGKSLQKQIVPWIAQHEHFKKDQFVGISFCDQNGKWKVYDIKSKYYIPRGSSIPDHQTFVIFDQARTRGADLKMNADIIAAISLGPQMTRDKFMQAAGRLRKLGRNQKLIMMASQQIFTEFKQFKDVKVEDLSECIMKTKIEDLSNSILAWCLKNSIEQNEKIMTQFGTLGWNHIRSKINEQVYVKQITSKLDKMYEDGLEKTTVAKLNQKIIKQLSNQYTNSPEGKHIASVLNTYGQKVYRQASNLDDVCERQVEPQPQVQKEQQQQLQLLRPIPQTDQTKTKINVPQLPISFDKKFNISQNFINTTKKANVLGSEPKMQLSELYFILSDNSALTAITLRQASRYIQQTILAGDVQSKKISCLNNCSIQDDFIKDNHLEGALVSAKLLSGVENYSQAEEQYLLQIFFNSEEKNKGQDLNFQKLTEFILRKKRVYLKKYTGSTLDKIVIRLKNEAMNAHSKNAMKSQIQDPEESMNKMIQEGNNKIYKLQWKRIKV